MKHSTSKLLVKFRDDTVKAMIKGEITIATFVDFSKTFDTTDYAVLTQKIRSMNTSHLIFRANQMTGFYMKCNAGLKRVKKTKLILLAKKSNDKISLSEWDHSVTIHDILQQND